MYSTLQNSIKIVIIILTILASSQVSASPITLEEALSNVQEFLHLEGRHKIKGDSKTVSLAYTIGKSANGKMIRSKAVREDCNALIYVFNYGDDKGFVVASGDDMAEPILGFSDEGVFNADDIPVNLAELLIDYADEIAWATTAFKNEDFHKENGPSLTAQASKKTVKTLMTTRWNQKAPFNNKCKFGPKKTACLTGCVATAMGQLLYYWGRTSSVGKYKGGCAALGKYTTRTKKYVIPVLPKLSSFNWPKMVQKKGKPKNKASKAAVATLMRYTSQSVYMDYTPTSSAAYIEDAAYALRYLFHFDCDLSVVYADDMTSTEFANLIYSELVAKRPVIMAGSKSNYKGGHAFVCDGYSSKKKAYHINWGWGGSYNGYFKFTALKPVKGHNYSSHKIAIVGVDPLARTCNQAPSLEESGVNDDEQNESTFSLEATGIEETTNLKSLDRSVIYNLQGQRVEHPSEGLYIVNGKKVFIK